MPPIEPGDPLVDLPPDASLSWIPGASGSLRVAERHPEGRRTLVFVHGLGGRLEHWAPIFRGVGPGLRSIALDLPGHGASDAPADGDLSVSALASAIGALFDGLRLRSAVLVAHSLGALAAIEYASRKPERVTGLLLLDPSGDQSLAAPEDRELFLEAVRHDARGECEMNFRHFLGDAPPRATRRVLEDLGSTPEEVLVGGLEGSATYAPAAALERFSGPVLSVVSDLNDSPISLHRLRPELRVRRIPRVSHWLMLESPDKVLEILWDFLEEL